MCNCGWNSILYAKGSIVMPNFVSSNLNQKPISDLDAVMWQSVDVIWLISTKVHKSPWVVTLRNALTPRPRYIRARPASVDLGFPGSGPGKQQTELQKTEIFTHCLPRIRRWKVSRTLRGGMPCQCTLLNFLSWRCIQVEAPCPWIILNIWLTHQEDR